MSQAYFEALTVGGTRLEAVGPQTSTTYAGLGISLVVEGVSKDHPYGLGLVGNHAQILAAQFIKTPVGPAYLALSEQTPPAASGSTQPQYQYWIAVYRRDPSRTDMDIAYCIEAIVLSGQPTAAERSAVLALLSHWEVPAAQ